MSTNSDVRMTTKSYLFTTMLLLLLLCLCVSLCLLSLYLLCVRPVKSIHDCYLKQNITCARFIPLVGHLFSLQSYSYNNAILQFLWDCHNQYGIVYSLCIGPLIRLTINDPRYVACVLKNDHSTHYTKTKLMRVVMKQVIGLDNLLATEAGQHTKHRRMISPAFHYHNLKDMVSLMYTEAVKSVERWIHRDPSSSSSAAAAAAATAASGSATKQIELVRELSSITLCIIASCAFGPYFLSYPDSISIVRKAFDGVIAAIQLRFLCLIELIPLLRDLPILRKPMMDQARQDIQSLVERCIEARKTGLAGSTQTGAQDLLHQLLTAVDPETGEKLTDREVRDEAMTFVLAGHETTSNLMSWLLYIMSTRPSLWNECKQEVDRVIGKEAPDAAQLTQLTLIDAVIHETLRVFPPVPVIVREVQKTHTIGGDDSGLPPICLPLGSQLHIQPYIIHRLPEYWGSDAKTFDHTRWLSPAGKRLNHSFQFLPFSAGARSCIGQQFALLESKVILVAILQRVRSITLVPGQKHGWDGFPVSSQIPTLRPKYGIKVDITAR